MEKVHISVFGLVILFAVSLKVDGQPLAHITNVPDTSFTVGNEYKKNISKYPFISIVPDSVSSSVAEQRNLVYCKMGTREMHIDAFTPATKKKKTPAILIVHGGAWRTGNRTQHIPLAQHLAARGYASFTIEYRLSTEAVYPAALLDLKTAVRWIRSQAKAFNIDTNKIAILGFSAGGQLAALTGITTGTGKFDSSNCNQGPSSALQAVVDIDGTLSFVHPDAPEAKSKSVAGVSGWWIGYLMSEREDVWADASPLTYVAQNRVPFLFLNSAVERMHVGQTEFKKEMDSRGIYSETISFDNTPHSFCLFYPWFNDIVDGIDGFLKRVFK